MPRFEVVHFDIETKISLEAGHPFSLIIESPCEFFKLVSELNSQAMGGEGNFVFLKDGQEVAFDKTGDFVCDFFNFDLNDKKIVSLLYKQLEQNCMQGEKFFDFNKINTDIAVFLNNLLVDLPFEVTFDEMPFSALLKSTTVLPASKFETLEEKLICYINAMLQLKNCGFFVFVGLKQLLSPQKLKQVFHHCELEDVPLLLIEFGRQGTLFEEERGIVITEDLCELLVNLPEMI